VLSNVIFGSMALFCRLGKGAKKFITRRALRRYVQAMNSVHCPGHGGDGRWGWSGDSDRRALFFNVSVRINTFAVGNWVLVRGDDVT